jgi:hypothetical protein
MNGRWPAPAAFPLAVVLAATALAAQPSPLSPTPASRGGYGAPAAQAPSSAGLKPTPAPAAPAWLADAESRLGSDVDDIIKRHAATDSAWANAEARVDTRTRQLLQQAGFSASDIATFYAPPSIPENLVGAYAPFYGAAERLLTHLDLRKIGNPPIFANRPDLPYPDGNRTAVEAAMAALDGDIATFRYLDGVIQERLAAHVDSEAHLRFLFADLRRNAVQYRQALNQRDNGPYDDPANVAARAKFRPLEYRDSMLLYRTAISGEDSLERDYFLAGWELALIRDLPIFADFERLSGMRTYVMVRRTDTLVPTAEVARRMHEHLLDLSKRSVAIYDNELFKRWNFAEGPFLDFYQRQANAVGAHLRLWVRQGGATEEQLAEVDAQMTASEAIEPKFSSAVQQRAALEQQILPLRYRVQDLGAEATELDGKADQLASSGDSADATTLRGEEKPLIAQEKLLAATASQLEAQEAGLDKANQTVLTKADFVTLDPVCRALSVEFDILQEDEPEKLGYTAFPLKGAPVDLRLSRAIPDAVLGVPMVLRVQWERDSGAPPPTQAFTLKIGGTTVPLTLYLDATGVYRSARLILQPADVPAQGAVEP